MDEFQAAYKALNTAQKEAVDTTEGPVLVLAGPGTGKTQLLSTRAANIVAQGTVSANNILCLTYTETGAQEMRLRMNRIMGITGGDVAVHTFHGFGSWLISQYPETFSTQRALQPLDDLARFRAFESLLSALPLRHALAVRDADDTFLRQGNVQEAIRVFKQAGLSPANLRSVLRENHKQYAALLPILHDIFNTTLSAKRLPAISDQVTQAMQQYDEGSYGALLLHGLQQAVQASIELGKSAPLGAWRTTHMQIVNGEKVLKSAARHQALLDVLKLYEQYQQVLAENGRFDYEDMVLWAVQALQKNDDMRQDIAERFQYIMVDEYQDTNGAQNALLNAIVSANPLDAPNIMVVGDDDQAIMRFQGAELSGLLEFVTTYQPKIITLTDNYRSGQAILDASRTVMIQTSERLEASLPTMQLNKSLTAQINPAKAQIEHQLYTTQVAQYQGVAISIKKLIASGTPPTDIAIIGRKHKELVAITGYLQNQGIAVNYDYREHILSDQRLHELLQLATYVQLLGKQSKRADQLLPSVLKASYWQLAPLDVYALAATAKRSNLSWLDTMLTHADTAWQHRAEWLLAAAAALPQENFTTSLDMLIGRTPLPQATALSAPFSTYLKLENTADYLSLLSHLLRLREAVLQSRPQANSLNDLLETVREYEHSNIMIVDNNPLLRGDQAGVSLLSAHGAKGREFDHIYVLSAVDSVWGNRARGHNQRIHLPENLPLYPAGDNESDRLRLLYVAMTRAKSHLVLISYEQTDDGKPVVPLSFIQNDDRWQPNTMHLDTASTVAALETGWLPAAPKNKRDLRSAIAPLLNQYRMSPTALGSFLNIRYAGPQTFLETSVLGFPSAYTASSALGQAAHAVLEQAQRSYSNNEPMTDADIVQLFNSKLDASGLPASELQAARTHGEQFLPPFVDRFSATDFGAITSTEQYFKTILPRGTVPFGGKVDAIIETDTGITILDYKTGKPPLANWETQGLTEGKKISLHFYRQQLMCYKLLLDAIYAKQYKNVQAAELVFLEPPENGEDYIRLSITNFSKDEIEQTATLIAAVYTCLTRGILPDITGYTKDLKGILQFEADLLAQ